MANVFIPNALRKYTGGKDQAQVPGETLGAVIKHLEIAFPGISAQLVEDNDLTSGLAAIIDGEATVEGLLQKLPTDAEIHFLPAISGG
jgi:molybdopterin converting factor small subunit